ncbi:MAG: CBS domain-containing protein, partial [Vulcanimicrobiota bacterium]
AIFKQLAMVNGILFLFNLIPGLPLDGGHVLQSFLWHFTGDLEISTRISSYAGIGLGISFILLASIFLVNGALLNGVWLVFIGLFIISSAKMSYQNIKLEKILQEHNVKVASHQNYTVLPKETTIREAVENYLLWQPNRVFLVFENMQMEKNGKFPADNYLGIISMKDIKAEQGANWHSKTLEVILKQKNNGIFLKPDMNLKDALRIMTRNEMLHMAVVEDGFIEGVLSQVDILKMLEILQTYEKKR